MGNMVNIGLSDQTRKSSSDILGIILANEYLLYTKTLNYHWNVKGELFGPLHAFFKGQYEELFEIIDKVAERIATLGFPVQASLKEFSGFAKLPEFPGKKLNYKEMLKNLLDDHEAIIKHYRSGIDETAKLNDAGTNNFLAEIMEDHEKTAWMIRSHLES